MLLRLILVSIVAGLGASPPAESDLAGWSQTVRSWLDGRIAEWVVLEGPNTEVVVGAPGGEDAPSLEELIGELTDQSPDEVVLAGTEASPGPNAPPAVEASIDAEAARRAFEAIVEEMAAEFSSGRGALVVVTPTVPGPGIDQDAIDQLDETFDDEELATGGQVAIEAGGAIAATVVDSTLSDEALALVDDVYPGLAYAADFETEPSLETAAPAPTPTPGSVLVSDGTDDDPREAASEEGAIPHSAGNPLGRAVGLTREAVYAWLNLLQSPAIVTLPE
jgi:hypothetical protein